MIRPVAEQAIRRALADAFAPVRVATEVPADLTVEVIVVDRIGGADAAVFDYVTLDIDVFAPTLAAAQRRAEEVRGFIRDDLPGRTVDGLTVALARTTNAPTKAPYGNPNTRRVTATYALAVA